MAQIVTSQTNQNTTKIVTPTIINKTTISSTTTTTKTEVVEDIDYVEFMRPIDIDIVSYSLRPRRQIYAFFDNVNIARYIEQPNKIVLAGIRGHKDFLTGLPENVSLVGGNAQIFVTETDTVANTTTLYVSSFVDAKTNVRASNTATGMTSGNVGTVVSYEHHSGYIRGASSNTTQIALSLDSDRTTANLYVGNVISIVTGNAAGQRANIISYNAVTQIARVYPYFTTVEANAIYTIGDSRKKFADNTSQALFTTQRGFFAGTFHVPNPVTTGVKFRTGDRALTLIDSPSQTADDYTTRADYRFTSNGLVVEKTQIIQRNTKINSIDIDIEIIPTPAPNTANPVPPEEPSPLPYFPSPVQPVVPPPTPTPQPVKPITPPVNPIIPIIVTPVFPRQEGRMGGGKDPIAQTFFVDPSVYPQGFFIDSIDVFFKNKSSTMPIEMQIRPCGENDTPSSTDILPGAVCVLQPSQIKTSDTPNTAVSSTATKFKFPAPVYVKGGLAYAFCLITDTLDYDIYSAELGEKILGTNRVISSQPYIGSLFKSQNSRVYTPIQSEDLMFTINKCSFVQAGAVVYRERKASVNKPNLRANTYADTLHVVSDAAELPGTKINYYLRSTFASNSTFIGSHTEIVPERNIFPYSRQIIYGEAVPTNSIEAKMVLSTTNADLSPVLWRQRQEVVAVENIINNMPLSNTLISITNGGASYNAANSSLVITGLTGSGANAYIAQANASTGAIESIIVDSPGSGYFDNVTISVVSASGSGAVLNVATETGASGGPGLMKYISKPVALADGFNAGDLRCFVTAIRPAQSNIQVYYKVRNELDPDDMDVIPWQKMEQHTSPYIFSTNSDPIEYEYRPSLTRNNISYFSQTANSNFTTFNQYAIKIVGASSNTHSLQIPQLLDHRTMALPADIF